MTSRGRTNILFIMTDQQFAGAMSCAGNTDLHTPAMDSLAETGVTFERAYCTQPLCGPARASMFTGLMPHQAGAYTNGLGMHDHLKSRGLGWALRRAGYDCVYTGKWHVPEGTIPVGHGFRQLEHDVRDDHAIALACAEFLRQGPTEPFFLVTSFVNPHDICQWARGEPLPRGPIPDGPPDEWPKLPLNYGIPDDEPDIVRAVQPEHPKAYPTIRFDDDQWRHYRYAYYRLVEKVDREIGCVLDALRESGLEENTLVVFTSDHGDGHGAHHWNQKQVLYEEVVRVPLIVSQRGTTLAGSVDRGHLISVGLDLYPTLCGVAEAELPEGLDGRSFRALAEGCAVSDWRDQVIVETVFAAGTVRHLNAEGRMVRTSRFKYVVYSPGKTREQLFDLERDPGEMRNLAFDPAYRTELLAHRERLKRWCAHTGDPFSVPGRGV